MKKQWIVGTRGSSLAVKQTGIVIEALKGFYPECEFPVKIIKTTGDTVWDTPLHLIGGKGLFVKEIEEALLSGQIDIAVHSMKDLPTELGDRLTVGAVLKREDPRDVFISSTHTSLRNVIVGGKIGTSSMRRKSQILHLNKNLEVVNLRGNVDTRIRKLKEQNLDGIILAYAGVRRMGLEGHISEILPFEFMVPPSGQGAIGIETRMEHDVLEMLKPINHENSFLEVSVERKLQAGIGGGCQVPLGINAAIINEIIHLHVVYGNENGELYVKEKLTGNLSSADELIAQALKIIPKI